jgi:hypothetical protein
MPVRGTYESLDADALDFADKSYMTRMNNEIAMSISCFKDIHNPDITLQ